MFLEAELVMPHDVCQPTNSFRGLCELSEQTESSATPSDGSLFGRPYGTEALGLSPALTSKDWQRCPTHFPYPNFFPLLNLPSFLFFISCQGLISSYRLPRFSFFSVLLALAGGSSKSKSSFQSWQGPRLCAGCKGTFFYYIIHYCSHLSHFGAMLRSDCWTTQLPLQHPSPTT